MNNKVKEKRLAKGLTQEELAEKSGVTRVTIANIERGVQVDIKVSSLKKIAKALGCKVSDLIS